MNYNTILSQYNQSQNLLTSVEELQTILKQEQNILSTQFKTNKQYQEKQDQIQKEINLANKQIDQLQQVIEQFSFSQEFLDIIANPIENKQFQEKEIQEKYIQILQDKTFKKLLQNQIKNQDQQLVYTISNPLPAFVISLNQITNCLISKLQESQSFEPLKNVSYMTQLYKYLPKNYQIIVKNEIKALTKRTLQSLETNCNQFSYYKVEANNWNSIYPNEIHWNQQANMFIPLIPKQKVLDEDLQQYLTQQNKDKSYLSTYYYDCQRNNRQKFEVLSPKGNQFTPFQIQNKKIKNLFKRIYDDQYIRQQIFPEHIIYSILLSTNRIVQQLKNDEKQIFQMDFEDQLDNFNKFIQKLVFQLSNQLDFVGCVNLHCVLRKIPAESFSIEVMQLMNQLLRILQSKSVFMVQQQIFNVFKIKIDMKPSTTDFYKEKLFKIQNEDEIERNKQNIIYSWRNEEGYQDIIKQRVQYIQQSIKNFDQTFYTEFCKGWQSVIDILGGYDADSNKTDINDDNVVTNTNNENNDTATSQ